MNRYVNIHWRVSQEAEDEKALDASFMRRLQDARPEGSFLGEALEMLNSKGKGEPGDGTAAPGKVQFPVRPTTIFAPPAQVASYVYVYIYLSL